MNLICFDNQQKLQKKLQQFEDEDKFQRAASFDQKTESFISQGMHTVFYKKCILHKAINFF